MCIFVKLLLKNINLNTYLEIHNPEEEEIEINKTFFNIT